MATIKTKKVAREFTVIQSDKDQQFYWHAASPRNGKTTFNGEGHPSSTKAVRAIVQEMTAVGATIPLIITLPDGKTVNKPAPCTPMTTEQAIELAQYAADKLLSLPVKKVKAAK